MTADRFAIPIPVRELEEFAKKWMITELALFGSVLREDFNPETSDIDVLVTYDPASRRSLWDVVHMKDELEQLFGRKVDIVSSRALKNPFRRHEILRTKRIVYAA